MGSASNKVTVMLIEDNPTDIGLLVEAIWRWLRPERLHVWRESTGSSWNSSTGPDSSGRDAPRSGRIRDLRALKNQQSN